MLFGSELLLLCFLTLGVTNGKRWVIQFEMVDSLTGIANVIKNDSVIRSNRIRREEGKEKCLDNKFQCEPGQCIDKLNVCDGINDCNNGLDERNDTCIDLTNIANCELNKATNTKVQCEFKGEQVKRCGERIAPWMTIKLVCNEGYIPADDNQWFDTNKCLETGEWLHPISTCKYGCGIASSVDIVDKDGKSTKKTYHPWNAIIYRQENGDYIPHCLGTLISPFSVVTDVGCTRTNDGKDLKAEDIKIGLGKTEIKFTSLEGKPQFIDVAIIKRDLTYYEENQPDKSLMGHFFKKRKKRHPKPTEDFALTTFEHAPAVLSPTNTDEEEYSEAIFSLKIQANLNSFVMPVCIDTNNEYKINASSVGTVFTWKGVNDAYLLQDVQLLDNIRCKEILDNHTLKRDMVIPKLSNSEFCALEKDCDPHCSTDIIKNGAGITIKINGKQYLLGVYKKFIPLENDRGKKGIFIFHDVRAADTTNHKSGQNIINEEIKATEKYRHSNIPDGKCSIPYDVGAKYTELPCFGNHSCNKLPTYEVMDQLSIMYVNCEKNYAMPGHYGYKMCIDGKWLSNETACVRLCEPLRSIETTRTNCFYEGKSVSCVDNVREGTIATSNCLTGDWDTDSEQINVTCQDNGKWQDLPQIKEADCTEKCGTVKLQGSSSGEVNVFEHPWNAAIYWKKGSRIVHICGGTLITKFAVLSAAHCVFDEYEDRLAAHVLKIGLGKFHKGFKDQNDLHAQYRDVKHLYVPNAYNGKISGYVFDIAIMELKEAANVNEFVLPACIDTKNKYQLKTRSSMGAVVGWGSEIGDEANQKTDKLRKVIAPYIDKATCWKDYRKKFGLKLTNDKFCAFNFNDNRQTVLKGDSGSGLTFNISKRHYVYGIVSTQSHNQVSMFTNVTFPDHLEFINNVLRRISENKIR